MAISVKNHEDRIKMLEDKIVKSGYSETLIYNTQVSLPNYQSKTISLTSSFEVFDLLWLIFNCSGNGPTVILVPVSRLKTTEIEIYRGADGNPGLFRGFWVKRVSSTSLQFRTKETDPKLYSIIGVKFSNVILYYVSNIIYTKFKLRLNSAIVIFNRLFLHKFITGGETWKWL